MHTLRDVDGPSLAGKDARTCRRVLQYCWQLGLIHIGAVHTADLIYHLRVRVFGFLVLPILTTNVEYHQNTTLVKCPVIPCKQSSCRH